MAVKVKVALVLLTEPVGPAVMVVSGATVSTVHVRDAGVRVRVAGGVGRAHCERVRALREAGVAGRARAEGGAVERALERRAGLGGGEGERRAGAVDRAARAGGDRRVRCDGVDRPRARRRRARRCCRRRRWRGPGRCASPARGRCSPPGTCRTRRRRASTGTSTPASVEPNVNVALVLLTEPVGPAVIVVSGATVSTVHVREAGEASVLPAASVARTWKVCDALREAGVARPGTRRTRRRRARTGTSSPLRSR